MSKFEVVNRIIYHTIESNLVYPNMLETNLNGKCSDIQLVYSKKT